jgi:hypothetical protein
MERQLIQVEMIEANDFFEIAMRYNVSGVPQTNINNGAGVILGSVPEGYLLQDLVKAVEFLTPS